MSNLILRRPNYLIVLFICLLSFGNIGGALMPIRIGVILFSFQILSNYDNLKKIKSIKPLLLFFQFIILYASLSLIWSEVKVDTFKEIFYYIIHISLFLLILIWGLKLSRPVYYISLGWLGFLLITLPLALYEIVYDVHLNSSSLLAEVSSVIDGQIINKTFAAVTFGNYNNYVTIICCALPFVFGIFFERTTKFIKYVAFVVLIFVIYVLFVNASRGGLLCLFVDLTVFLFYAIRYNRIDKLYLVFILVCVLLFLIYFKDILFEQLFYRFKAGSSFSHDEGRFEIYSHIYTIFEDSLYLGIGVGSYQYKMNQIYAGISAAHNFFLEFMVQFGMYLFAVLLYFVFMLGFRGFKSKTIISKFLLISFFLSLPFLSVINSTYLLSPYFWVYFSCLYIVYINSYTYD